MISINVLIFSFCFSLKCSLIAVLFKSPNQFGSEYFGFPSNCICQYLVLKVYMLLLMCWFLSLLLVHRSSLSLLPQRRIVPFTFSLPVFRCDIHLGFLFQFLGISIRFQTFRLFRLWNNISFNVLLKCVLIKETVQTLCLRWILISLLNINSWKIIKFFQFSS